MSTLTNLMKFRSKNVELAALSLIGVLVYVVLGGAFRMVSGHWPSLGFWLGDIVVYVLVTLPAMNRAWRKTDAGTSS